MKAVYKYVLTIADYQKVKMPFGSVILTVAIQNGVLCLWALVDPAKKEVERTIRIAGTGHSIKEGNTVYIGTVLMVADSIVFHIFEIT